jgi:hypothetical protein
VTSSKVLAGLAFCEFFIPRFSYLRMEAIFNTAGTPLKFYIILRAGMMGFFIVGRFWRPAQYGIYILLCDGKTIIVAQGIFHQ